MSKITVTTIAGATSGADANKVKIESGDDFVVDTNVLKVDASNNRVGIGTTSPNNPLEIAHTGSAGAGGLRIGDPSTIASDTGIYLRTTGDAVIGAAGGDIVFDTNMAVQEDMRINSSGHVTTPRVPSFSVNATPSLSSNTFVSYGSIKFNNGNHYNNTTGRFTAPVAGKYFFTCSLWPTSGSIDNANSYLVFYKNNSEYFGGHVGEEYHNITIAGVIDLAVNDYVSVVRAGSWTIQASTPRNNFHGFLIG